MQLAFDEVGDRKLTKPERGHLKANGVAPHRRLVEIRGEHQLAAGETVTVESFEPGEKVKVSGVSIGKGFQGTIKRHNFSRGPVTHGSHNVRKPGLGGCLCLPFARLQGDADGGTDGGAQRSPSAG